MTMRFWIRLGVAAAFAACLLVIVLDRLEIGRLSRERDRLRTEREKVEEQVRLAERGVEGARAAVSQEAPGAQAAVPAEEAAFDIEALLAQLSSLRSEVDSWRELPGETAGLLAILSNPTMSSEERAKAVERLLGQCDVLAHAGELLDAFAKESDPEVRKRWREVMPELAAKFRSAEMADAVMKDLRDGGRPEACASMLARLHGAEGLDAIRAYLGDASPDVRRAAIQAVGRNLPKSDEIVSALFDAERHPDPSVRARASFSLANHGEAYSYPGMFDDWRTLTLSMPAEDFATIGAPGENLFGPLSDGELGSLLDVVGELGRAHPDEKVRHFMTSVHRHVTENGIPGR